MTGRTEKGFRMGRALGMVGFGLALALAGCGSGRSHAESAGMEAPPPDWRVMATKEDRQRIRTWRDGWTQALADVAAAGESPKLAPLGALMQPDTALADPAPPPGDYACRIYKLGAKQGGRPRFATMQPVTCRITREKDVLSFTTLSGPQKPVGFLLPDSPSRMIFLGTMMLSDERHALDYASDPERDMAGAFERVGPQQWRLVLPFPHWESKLDVIELTPRP